MRNCPSPRTSTRPASRRTFKWRDAPGRAIDTREASCPAVAGWSRRASSMIRRLSSESACSAWFMAICNHIDTYPSRYICPAGYPCGDAGFVLMLPDRTAGEPDGIHLMRRRLGSMAGGERGVARAGELLSRGVRQDDAAPRSRERRRSRSRASATARSLTGTTAGVSSRGRSLTSVPRTLSHLWTRLAAGRRERRTRWHRV